MSEEKLSLSEGRDGTARVIDYSADGSVLQSHRIKYSEVNRLITQTKLTTARKVAAMFEADDPYTKIITATDQELLELLEDL